MIAESNPALKPSEIVEGKGVHIVPGAIDKGSGRIANVIKSVDHGQWLVHLGNYLILNKSQIDLVPSSKCHCLSSGPY